MAKAKDQNSKKKSNSLKSDDESDKGGASCSAEALKLKVKTPEEIDKRRVKKARQALKRDIANALKKELGRAPTDKEVEAYMEREAEDIAKVEKIKGITQPKRQDKLVTYTGVLGDAKASPRGSTTEPEAMGAEIRSSTDDHALMLPWSVFQSAKEALMADPSLATEVFKESQERSRKRVHKDSDDSSSSDNNEEAPKNRLSCCKARECGNDNLKWSHFLLIDAEDADWQGFLWGVCQSCSDLDKKTFKRLARKRKEVRSEHLRGKRQRARMITLANCMEVIGGMFPGASQRVRRELAVARSLALASAGCRVFDNMSKEAKIASDINCQNWLKMVEKNAEDPSMACPIDARVLTATECSYLTNIATGWTFSFICRIPTCMFYGMNDAMTWIAEILAGGTLSDYHFRCPRCGEENKPTTAGKNQVKASFCMSITDPETGVVEHVPVTWPPSNDLAWINNQIEIHARQMETPADLDAWMNRSCLDIKKLIQEQSIPGHFVKLSVGQDAIWRCEQSNKWNMAPIKERGYVMGRHFTDIESAREPYSNWNELIGIFASHLRASREITARRQ